MVLFFVPIKHVKSIRKPTLTFKSKPKTVLLVYCVAHQDLPQKSTQVKPFNTCICYGNTNKRPTWQTPCLLSFY